LQPNPKGVITAQVEAGDFYFNKILVLAKGKTGAEQENHRNYVKNLKALFNGLADYAGDNFKMGLNWKSGGGDVASFKPGQKAASSGSDSKKTPEGRLEAVAARLERLAAKEKKGGADGAHPAVTAYEELKAAHLTPFLATLDTFPALKNLHGWTTAAFEHQGKVIKASTVSAKPTDEALMKFVAPISKVIEDSGKIDNKSEFFPHFKSYNEVIQGLGWVLQPNPKAAVTGQIEAGDFYFNKILVLAKGKTGAEQENHRNYVKNLKALFNALAEYSGEYFKMGLTWKSGGAPLEQFK